MLDRCRELFGQVRLNFWGQIFWCTHRELSLILQNPAISFEHESRPKINYLHLDYPEMLLIKVYQYIVRLQISMNNPKSEQEVQCLAHSADEISHERD